MSEILVVLERELKRRVTQAQEAMKKTELDGLFLTSDENYHFSVGGGIAHMRSNIRPSVMIVPAEGESVVVTSPIFDVVLGHAGLVKDIRPYNSVTGVPTDILVKAVKDTGPKHKKIGVGMGLEQCLNIPLKDYLELTKSLPT